MLQLTKIFHFETAHALHGYAGACKNIHGHSYELHVTVSSVDDYQNYIPAPGFMIDFKEIKKLVNILVVENFDHKVILSKDFLSDNPSFSSQENLVIFEAEPTAENLLIYILSNIQKGLPSNIQLVKLKLYETNDSYAEWVK